MNPPRTTTAKKSARPATPPVQPGAKATGHLTKAAPASPTAYVEPEPAGGSRLEHFPVTFFAIVMGLAGFTLAWLRAHVALGAPAAIGEALFWVSLAVYAAVLATYLAKWARYPAAVRDEVSHPIRLAFVPTASIGLLLIAAAGREIAPGLATALWWVGVAAQLVATLAVLTTWINRPAFGMQHVSPAWFIPVVGNMVVPLGGATLGPPEVSWFFWSAGIVFWLALLPLVLTRLFVHEAPVPAKLLPTLAILIAPPAVAFVSLRLLAGGDLTVADRVLYYSGAFFALLFLAQVGRLRKLPFFLSWWAYSFPLAALTVSTTIMAGLLDSGFLTVAAWTVLAVGSALVILLAVRTAGAMLAGKVCVPE